MIGVSAPASTVGSATEANAPKKKNYLWAVVVCFVLVFLFGLFSVVLEPMGPGLQRARSSLWLQDTRTIGFAMFQYSNDQQDGKYPDGKSSTEVFQKLLDEKYISDPAIFYLPISGKTKPIEGQPLKPENVCYDVTSGIGSNDSDGLPVVFMTGYKINYVPSGAAVPLIKSFPQFSGEPITWIQWLNGEQQRKGVVPGIAVCYKSNCAVFMRLETAANSDGTIPNFIPPDFDAQGKTYRQLTPDGPLP